MKPNKNFDKVSLFIFKIARKFLFLTIYLIILFFIGQKLFSIGYDLFYEQDMYSINNISITESFTITNDDTWDTIAFRLYSQGLISDENIFKFRANIYKVNLNQGTYEFNTKLTMKNILDIIDLGEIVNEENV
ncbi:MAG: hypothetical protein Q4F88_06285, partial [Eubacteriales bacterium]|nr:hypothetical protein [Eubacteriales bacterium]